MRKINSWGIVLIRTFEELRLEAYDDARPHYRLKSGDDVIGTLTIGYGHTGKDVFIGQTITVQEANILLAKDIEIAERSVNKLVTFPVNDNQFSALVSFEYNTGRLGTSTLLKLINAGELEKASEEFDKWVYARKISKMPLAGLMNRRFAERELFEKESVA